MLSLRSVMRGCLNCEIFLDVSLCSQYSLEAFKRLCTLPLLEFIQKVNVKVLCMAAHGNQEDVRKHDMCRASGN